LLKLLNIPSAIVKIILDKIYNKIVSKPINLYFGYDMKYVFNYYPQTNNYQYKKMIKIKK